MPDDAKLMKKLTLRIDEDLAEELERHIARVREAAGMKVSRGTIVRSLLERALDNSSDGT